MSSPGRMLVVVGALSIGAVLLLGGMARRYAAIVDEWRGEEAAAGAAVPLERRPAPAPQRAVAEPPAPTADPSPAAGDAARYVEAFIEVRRAMRDVIYAREGAPDPRRLAEVRDLELDRAGLDRARYLQLRRVYRGWREGTGDPADPFVREFEARRAELDAVALGAAEASDP